MTRFLCRLSFLAFTFATLSAALPNKASAQRNMRRPLSASERAQLRAGQLVVRPTTERRGTLRLFGGTSYILVDQPIEQVWEVLQGRSSNYRHMLPQVQSSHELERDGDSRVIRFHHEVGPINATYSVRFEYEEATHTVIFRLDASRPHDVRAAWGFFRLRASGQRTLITFGAMMDVGDGLLTSAIRDIVHEWVLKIPLTFKHYLQRRARRARRNHH